MKTTLKSRAYWREKAKTSPVLGRVSLPVLSLVELLDDADELARLRRHIEMQRNQWLEREREYKRGCDGARAAEAGFTADTLNLLLNNGDGDG